MARKRDRSAHKMSAEELAGWLHVRHRAAMGTVPNRKKANSRRACRNRKLWQQQ